MSNQGNQPWIDVVNCLVRESTYVLDGLLYQDAPPIKEHYVDTGGFTELLFGSFMLLGFRFAPRLSDLSDQTLYRPRKHTDYSVLTPVLKKDIREDLIVRHWDDIKPIRRFLMRVHPIKRIVLVVLPVIAALSLALFFSAHASPSASAGALHPQKPLSGCCAIIYTHIATASNTTANWTELDNNDTNNNPKAFVIVTPNRSASPGHVVDDHPVGVWYDGMAGKWAIFNQDGAAMPINAAFDGLAS